MRSGLLIAPGALQSQIRAVATKFILTAVAGRDTAASWNLLDRSFPGKSEFTKETWARGAIPVTPFPAKRSGIHLAVRNVRSKSVLLEVLLTTKKRRPAFFELGLRDTERGKRRWLVDYWNLKYVHSGPGFE